MKPSAPNITGYRRANVLLALVGAGACAAPLYAGGEPAYTILADFEDDSVASSISGTKNVATWDCAVEFGTIPARGTASLTLTIDAAQAGAAATCALVFREPTRFAEIKRVGAFCWTNDGKFDIAFRLRDADARIFETGSQAIEEGRRWLHVMADAATDTLKCVEGEGDPRYPLEVAGFRVVSDQPGKRTLFIDELQVEHDVEGPDLLRAEFEFSEPTHIFEPGAAIGATVGLESRSRTRPLNVAVELAWTRPDGVVLQTQRGTVNLPPGGVDFRSRQRIDFSQVITQPGLYKLVARARIGGQTAPRTFETTIAVTPSNRGRARGRATLFGLQTNLFREPGIDRALELDLASDLGPHLLAVETPWRLLEPRDGKYDFKSLTWLVNQLVKRDIVPLLILSGPPEWAAKSPRSRTQQLEGLFSELNRAFGEKLNRIQLAGNVVDGTSPSEQLSAFASLRNAIKSRLTLIPPAIELADSPADPAIAQWVQSHPDWPVAYRTSGGLQDALSKLAVLANQAALRNFNGQYWFHTVAPQAGSGTMMDAEAVLRYYIRAAELGVASAIIDDLRDDNNDPEDPPGMLGLARRDYSPKAALLGYATAVGELGSRRYAGPVLGADPAYESAMFIGSDMHLAVLLPKADAQLPAVLLPICGSEGTLGVHDFERRPVKLLDSVPPPLALTMPGPMFVGLQLPKPQPEPQIAMAKPWIRMPRSVRCGQKFFVEIDAPQPLRSSFAQIILPPNAPAKPSVSSITLKAKAGETVRQDLEFALTEGASLSAPLNAILRVSIEGQDLDIPFQILPAAH